LRRSASSRRRSLPLQLEQLEDRAVPALVAVGNPIPIGGWGAWVNNGQAVSQAASNGNFAVAWTEEGHVNTQLFSASGTALTGDIAVGDALPNQLDTVLNPFRIYRPGISSSGARVAMSSDGSFVVVWTYAVSGTEQNIYGERFNADGSAAGTFTAVANGLDNTEPSVAINGSGEIVVAYTNPIGTGGFVRAAVIAPSGLVADVAVGAGQVHSPSVAVNTAGHFVVAYVYNDPNTGVQSVEARRFDSSGNWIDWSAIQVPKPDLTIFNHKSKYNDFSPSVVLGEQDNYVVAFTRDLITDGDGSLSNVNVVRYGPQPQPFGTLIQPLNLSSITGTPSDSYDPAVAMDANGNFVVAYTSGGYPKGAGVGDPAPVITVRLAQFTADGQQEPGTVPVTAVPPSTDSTGNSAASVALSTTSAVAVYEGPASGGAPGEGEAFAQPFTISSARVEIDWPPGVQQISLTNGQSFALPVTVYRDLGFTGDVQLTPSNLPTGIHASVTAEDPAMPPQETRTLTFWADLNLSWDSSTPAALEVSVAGDTGTVPSTSIPLPMHIIAGRITWAPSTSAAGAVVTIYGYGFLPGSQVVFGNSSPAASFNFNHDVVNPDLTSLQVQVPIDATSGFISVLTPPGARLTWSTPFTLGLGAIDSISPTEGKTPQNLQPGTLVAIHGSGFSRDSLVQFGDPNLLAAGETPAGIIPGDVFAKPVWVSADATEIDVQVPRYAITGTVSVITDAGVIRSPQPFIVHDYRNTNGFSFKNFGSTISWSDVQDEFGLGQTTWSVTLPIVGTISEPTPGALAFWGAAALILNGKGDCFGMSLESLHLQENPGLINADRGLPAGAAPTVYDLFNNQTLTHEIEMSMLAQFSLEMGTFIAGWEVANFSNAGVYYYLQGLLAQGQHPMISMEESLGNGHTIVAYDLTGSPDNFVIHCYDNNRPFDLNTEGTEAAHQLADLNSDVHVYGGQWYFSLDKATPWSGGLGSMLVVPETLLKERPTLPTSLTGIADYVFGDAPTTVPTVDEVMAFLQAQGALTPDNTAQVQAAVVAELAAPNPADALQISVPTNAVAGGAVNLSVTALNQAGNVDPGYTGTVHVSSTDSSFQPFTYTFTAADQGQHTFSVTLNSPGVQSVTVMDSAGALMSAVVNVSATISLDAHTLAGTGVYVDGVRYDTTAPFSAQLMPGQHSVYVTGFDVNWFSVNGDGTVSYDPSLEGVFSGAGTTSLTIKGSAVTLNASALSGTGLYLDGVPYNAAAPFTAGLLPGRHYLYVTGYDENWFTVNPDGTVAYDAALQGVFTGVGTRSLAVNGSAVTLNASALGAASLYVDGVLHNAAAPFTVTLLPGRHYLYVTGYDESWFTVNQDGTVAYDAALEGVFSGAGTMSLAINGSTIALDASALGGTGLYLDGVRYNATAPFTVTLLPGRHYLYVTGYDENWFTVNADGTIGYDAALEGVFSGAGTPSLAINGSAIALDASALGVAGLYLDGVRYDAAAPFTAGLLPGRHYLYVTGYEENWFTVNQDGTVSYDAALEGVFTGAGTTSLKVNGAAVTLNASALGVASLYVDGVLHDATAPFTVTLLPGRHYLYVTGYEENWFTVNPDGTISYDAALEGAFTGAGTTSLAVNGCVVSLNASALGVASLYVDGALYNASAPFSLRLLPGRHYVYVTGYEENWFTVNPDGTITYDASLEGAFTGQGTTSLSLLGRAVTLDLSALGVSTADIDGTWFNLTGPITLQLLPGEHYVYVPGVEIFFTVNADGTLDYDASLDGVLSGRGTSTLTFNG
jgi:hypothetical protein